MYLTPKYSVQVITESDKLTIALSLRNKSNKTVKPNILENTNRPFESDTFDNRSLHIGLYCGNGRKKELAGYSRLIISEHFESEYLKLLLSKNDTNLKKSTRSPQQKLACLEQLTTDNYDLLNSFCNSLDIIKTVYSETDYFIVDPKHRNIATCSLFVSYIFAICQSLDINFNFFSCSFKEVPLYSKYGLISFTGIKLLGTDSHGQNTFVFGTNLKIANTQKSTVNLLKIKTESRGIKWSGLELQEKIHRI